MESSGGASWSHPNEDGRRNATGKIIDALETVSDMRQRLLLKKMRPDGVVSNTFRREAHARVLNLYYELKPYRNTENLRDYWKNAELWPVDKDPFIKRGNRQDEWVTGLSSLENYEDMEVPVKRKRPGLGRGTYTDTETMPMTVEQLLRAAEQLDEAAVKLGFGVELPDEYDVHADPF